MALELSWGVERSQWEALFTQAGRSPLLQGWAWGEAKRAEGLVPGGVKGFMKWIGA